MRQLALMFVVLICIGCSNVDNNTFISKQPILNRNRYSSGQYHIVIKQIANRDPDAMFKLAFARYQDHVPAPL